jgi:hypothetical protein
MVQVYKIMNGVGGANSEQWFKMADNERATSNGSSKYSDLSCQDGDQNKVPRGIRQARKAHVFKKA